MTDSLSDNNEMPFVEHLRAELQAPWLEKKRKRE